MFSSVFHSEERKIMHQKAVLLGAFAGLAAAQLPPQPEGVKVIKSRHHENVTISFKEVRFLLANSCIMHG